MKIISWNVNGLRSIFQKGFWEWLAKSDPDILCLQEIKAQEKDLQPQFFWPKDYYFFFNLAIKKGYSGVAIFCKQKPAKIENKIGFERFDNEGRFLKIDFANFSLINLYLPHGGRQKENLEYKLEVYDHLFKYLKRLRNKNLILIGDFNIAHQEIDLARPKDNQNNIMFTPEERKQLDELVEFGFIDSFRYFVKENSHYTWWPYRLDARNRNLGWRLDYAFISQSLLPKLKKAFILSNVIGSDHCPIGLTVD